MDKLAIGQDGYRTNWLLSLVELAERAIVIGRIGRTGYDYWPNWSLAEMAIARTGYWPKWLSAKLAIGRSGQLLNGLLAVSHLALHKAHIITLKTTCYGV